MKRAALWIGAFLLLFIIPLVGGRDPIAKGLFFTGGTIWLLVGIAWAARGVVRYLRR